MQMAARHIPEIISGAIVTGRGIRRRGLSRPVGAMLFAAAFLLCFMFSPGEMRTETMSRRAETAGFSRRVEESAAARAKTSCELMLTEERFELAAAMLPLHRDNYPRYPGGAMLQLLLFAAFLSAMFAKWRLTAHSPAASASTSFHLESIFREPLPVRAGPALC